MASAAEGRSWALRLAMCRRSVLSLCGKASLRSRGTLNLAAVHRTAATQYTEAWVGRGAGRGLRTAPKWGVPSEPGGLTTDPELQARLCTADQYPQASEPQHEQEDLGPGHIFQLVFHKGKVASWGFEARSPPKPYRAAKC